MDRKLLNVNGVPTIVMCEPSQKLSEVLRGQLGLTGTKVACGQGQCGSCSVILNGKVVRSCTTTMKRVPAESEITTIEGIGTPDDLHPLQKAWIVHGGAQCGYCSPGFIVSSKALLDENPDPTREEVRDWWQKHANVCRCTGYKPLVDAVIDAAKVMRGERRRRPARVQGPRGRPHLEHAVPAADGRRQGHRRHRLRRRLRATRCRPAPCSAPSSTPRSRTPTSSPSTSARPRRCRASSRSSRTRTSRARTASTASSCSPRTRWPTAGSARSSATPRCTSTATPSPSSAPTRIEQARAAVDKVKVELEELPAYMNAMDAIARRRDRDLPRHAQHLLQPAAHQGRGPRGDLQDGGARRRGQVLPAAPAAPLLRARLRLRVHRRRRPPHHPLQEHRALPARPDDRRGPRGGGRQAAHGPELLGRHVRLQVLPDHGGACSARRTIATGRPVYLKYDYWMSIAYTGKRSPHYYHCKLAADENGKFLAMENEWWNDHGPYMEFGDNLTQRGLFCGSGYNIPSMRGMGHLVRTNHGWGAPFRAWGSPQAFFAGESVVDEMATKIGMDPFELRYKNLTQPGDTFPWGQEHEVYTFKDLFDMVKPYYDEAKKRYRRGVHGRGQEGRRHRARHLHRPGRRPGRGQRLRRAAAGRRRAHLQHLGGPRPGLGRRHAGHGPRGAAPHGHRHGADQPRHERHRHLARQRRRRRQPLPGHGRQRHQGRLREAHGGHAQGRRQLPHLRRDGRREARPALRGQLHGRGVHVPRPAHRPGRAQPRTTCTRCSSPRSPWTWRPARPTPTTCSSAPTSASSTAASTWTARCGAASRRASASR